MDQSDSHTILDLKNELVHTLDDFSQYLKFQQALGNREFSLSPETMAVMDKWGTPGWRIHGFTCQGPESSALMIIDSEGSFFKGPGGELLTKILKAMHLAPDQVFICNAADVSKIRNHLVHHSPKCILCLGEKAGRILLNRMDPIKELRGRFLAFESTPLMITYHPRSLISNPTLKRKVWDDVQQVMARTGG